MGRVLSRKCRDTIRSVDGEEEDTDGEGVKGCLPDDLLAVEENDGTPFVVVDRFSGERFVYGPVEGGRLLDSDDKGDETELP